MKLLKMYVKIKQLVLLTLAAAAQAIAQHPDAGTVAFPFLNMGYEARSVAMSGAAVAMPNDLYGALSNPAAAGAIGRYQIIAGYRQLFMDVWGGPLGFAYPTSKGVFAASLITLTTGDFDIIDEDGNANGLRAKSSYTAAGISFARPVLSDNLTAGITAKAIYHYISAGEEKYTADGYAADLGVQYRMHGGRLIYGAALRNFGAIRSGYLDKFNEYPMPTCIETGVSYVPRYIPNLRAALDVNKTRGDYLNFEPAAEYALLGNALFLRAGYTFSYMDLEKTFGTLDGERDEDYSKSNTNTLSLGLGLAATMDNVDLKIDAAMQFYADVSEPAFIMSIMVGF
jgi:hypothetical protein